MNPHEHTSRIRVAESAASAIHRSQEERVREAEAVRKAARFLTRASEVAMERAAEGGVYSTALVDRSLGFDNQLMNLVLQTLAPGGHTRSRRHGEAIHHVLDGHGYTLIDGVRFDWKRGDTFHLPSGSVHQHFNLDPGRPATHVALSGGPPYEVLGDYWAIESAGDHYVDPGDGWEPDHPFVEGRRMPIDASPTGERWMSSTHVHRHGRKQEHEDKRKSVRLFTAAEELKIERSAHKGDFITSLVDRSLGFDNRIASLDIHTMPPGSHTETHRHWEAILHILKGRGYALIDGQRYEWQTGDTIHIQTGVWHQVWNTDPANPSHILAAKSIGIIEHVMPYREEALDDDYTRPDPGFVPPNPWLERS